VGHLLNLVLASENKHKQEEFQAVLGESFRILTLRDVGFSQILPIESGSTYEENASIKAIFVGKELGVPVLADDSGFEVDALRGEPGVHSARFMGGADSRTQCLEILKRLSSVSNRSARFVCVLALYWPDSNRLSLFRGECEGAVATALSGDKGFGYDPIFVPSGKTKTFAELESAEKWKLSHRGRAFEVLRCSLG
jgi:XTP/dITP diphosphohydrolase